MGKRTPRPEEENKPRDVLARKRRDASFCKRRKTLFSKASKLCIEHDARIAVLVLSPAGKPYAFGHSSVDAVLNHYFNFQQEQPTTSVVNYEEHIMVECMKEGIENEVRACQTAQDIASLRERLGELSKKTNERLKNSPSSEYVFKAMSEENHIGSERRYMSGRSSGSHMVSPNLLFRPLPNFSTHARSLIDGGLSSGYGDYVLDYGNNYRSSWGGTEYMENIMPSYLSQSSSSNLLSPNFFTNLPCPFPNNLTHVPSLDGRLNSADDLVYGTNINCGEGSYEVLGNIGLGQDDPDIY
ncbi:hypothetical protein M0R45_012804 [Rubus argutus]|uniref:MADS-box domain-containing protein n=1 Tax=Rubus argutus TaxID=59490 RepID=A0AAW1XHZ5_RUBAR